MSLELIPESQIRILISLFLSIILSFFFKYVMNKEMRLLFSLIPGAFIQIYIYRHEVVYIHLTNLYCILLSYTIPRKYYGLAVNSFVWIVLTYIHYNRMFTDYGGWTMDINLAYMINLQKWSSFGFNYSDGEEEKQGESKENPYSIKSFSIKNFLCYMSFFPCSITGPFCEYNDYIDFINQKKNYENIKFDYKHIVKNIFISVIYLVVYVNIHHMLKVSFFVSKLDLLYKSNSPKVEDYLICLGSYFIIYLMKIRYIVPFVLCDISCWLSGISFENSKKDTSEIYSRVQSIRLYQVETTLQIKPFFRSWNIGTHVYLKRYVFKRLNCIKYFSVKVNESLTFIVSGLWHGLYPGYHIIFGLIIVTIYVQEKVENMKKVILALNTSVKYGLYLVYSLFTYFLFIICYVYLLIILDNLNFSELVEETLKMRLFPIFAYFTYFVFGLVGLFFSKSHTKSKLKEKKGE